MNANSMNANSMNANSMNANSMNANSMNTYSIENDRVRAEFSLHGAELISFFDKKSETEHMWCGDAAYWGRISPVLFPFVGKLTNSTYRYENKEYSGIPQHGFARDCDFVLENQSAEEIWFSLSPDETWNANYPFSFRLRLGYKLTGNELHVMWCVINEGAVDLPFSIGAHPAFVCPDGTAEDALSGYRLDFHNNLGNISYGILNEKGVLSEETGELQLTNGQLSLSNELFNRDALIITPTDIHTIGIVSPSGREVIRVRFDAPQLGIWSPVGKNAPFVCIEPWFGRCDRESFEGELQEREYSNILAPGHSFNKEYVIEVC